MPFICCVTDSCWVIRLALLLPPCAHSSLRTACLHLQLLPHVNWDVDEAELSAVTKMTSACEITASRVD